MAVEPIAEGRAENFRVTFGERRWLFKVFQAELTLPGSSWRRGWPTGSWRGVFRPSNRCWPTMAGRSRR